ncbi:hypothetical protein KSS87_014406 [Heliosperma pusillum]|nr:hypothetical protein KSS87_014406 [Heliosperma pusillum]
MADYLTKLPDDIYCYIMSLMTVRDTFRVKSLSSRWKHLPDCRSVLRFDSHTILGKDPSSFESFPHGSKFVKAVDQFLKIWSAQKTSALVIKFALGNEYASHIDGWIANVTGKEVEELDLDFSSSTLPAGEKYVFPCHLMHTEIGSCLKLLRLNFCHMTSISDVCSSWLSKLSSIELANVSLRSSDIECILSSSLNLESLSLIYCGLREYIFIQHRSLKKLVIAEDCNCIELSCPNLEIFEFSVRTCFIFSHISCLREATLNLYNELGGSSSVFSNLARNAPQLQTLSLWVTTEVSDII